MKDEELQIRIESGRNGESADEKAYRVVFDSMKKEPSFRLTPDFASRVVSRLELSYQTSSSRDFIWLCVGLFLFVVAAGLAIFLTDFKVSFGVMKFIAGYQGLFIFGLSFILTLHWIDKKLVRKAL